ncbi:MAG: ABC transporter permease [Desulfobacterota bacterium]|nr:ABC transporter permease [Thermodesulfobacteriota bacterium]MDW8002238.1 ABC transporter permease [Deltaproteobacteria bacterium]
MSWYPIFLREMIIFRRRLLRLGYIFSTLIVPIIYLFAFGLGIGRSFRISEYDYLGFLIPGLCALSSMNNSYTWVANGINFNRLYSKGFQMLIQSPISPTSIVLGHVFSGVVKGLFAASLIIVVGYLTGGIRGLSWLFCFALIVNSFMFASLGVIVGMITKSHEDTATYSNFLIIPMGFFSGTFFPVDKVPAIFKPALYVMPLTHTNILIRKDCLDISGLLSFGTILLYTLFFFLVAVKLVRDYSE